MFGEMLSAAYLVYFQACRVKRAPSYKGCNQFATGWASGTLEEENIGIIFSQ